MAKVSLILIFTLVLSTFMYQGWYKPKFSEAAPTADGMTVYSNNATTAVYRAYTASSNTFGAQTNVQAGVTAAQGYFVQKASKTRNEYIAGHVTTGGVLYIQRWNGSTWSAEWNVTVGGNGVNGRRFDIAYENTSGDAMVVYSTNAQGSAGNEMAYRVYNGSTWAAAVNIDSARLNAAAAVGAIKLASRPGTDEIALTAQSTGTTTANTGQLTSFIWSGSAWANEPATAHDTAMTNTTGQLIQYDNFDLAYESVSGDLLVVWSRQAAAYNGYRTYSAGTWGAVTVMGGTARAAMHTIARANPNGNEIMVAYTRSANANINGYLWSGTAMGTQTTIGANGVATATVSKMWITGEWVNVGGTDYGVAFWNTSTNGTIGHNTVSAAGAWGTAGTQVSGAGTRLEHMNADADPFGTDTIMLTWSDSASDLHARRVVVSAGPTLTYTTPTGSPLTATLANITTQNFDFAYKRIMPFFSFSSATYTQAEGNSGTANVTITVNRTGDTSGANDVTYATSDGTATTSGNDYVAATNTLSFIAGETSKTFTVTINGDTKYENNETVNLTLSSPTNGAMLISPSTATLTITNDDSQPSVAFNSATSTGYAYDNKVVIPVSLSGVSSLVSQVTYNTADGTAVAGTDYTTTSGTLYFFSDETTKYITVPLINNASINGKTFTLTISAPVNVTLGAPSTNTVTIQRKYSSSLSTCAQCHAYFPADATPTRGTPSGAVIGDHQAHQVVCSTCHVVPATQTSADFAHRNGNINMKTGLSGISSGYYDKDGSLGYNTPADDTWAQTNSPATATCRNISCHGGGGTTTPQWGVGTTDCTACHNVALGTRRAVMGEFSQTWNHSAADAYDCGVCHMEGAVSGSQTTGKADPAYHGNGTIELRDANTGTTIQGVTWSGPDAGQYTSTGSAISFTQFSRNLSSSTLEAPVAAITINHCLHCHDAGGSVVWAPTGSATNPFASGVAPLDVDAHFNTANASYHPVKGKQNNSYANANTMDAPWNYSKTTGNITSWGYLMSCFDCHAASGVTGTQTSTVVAHGGAVTLRALYDRVVTGPTKLCVVCHKQSLYWGSVAVHSASSTGGPGFSALNTVSDSNWEGQYHMTDGSETSSRGCTVCHGTGLYNVAPTRPQSAENAHGSDTIGSGASTWTSGARPYSFIRNTDHMSNFNTNGTTSCSMNTGCGSTRGPFTWTPGGTY